MAHFFVVISGSKIHERVAHFFIDIYTMRIKEDTVIDVLLQNFEIGIFI